MNRIKELARGLISAALEAEQKPASVDGLCAAAGWTADERQGDGLVLHFNAPSGGVRKVSVHPAAGGSVVLFAASSEALFDAVPQWVAEHVLARNGQLAVGAWSLMPIRQGRALFLMHRVPLAGLTGPAFKFICESLARETYDFDARLRS